MENLEADRSLRPDSTPKRHRKQESIDEVIGSLESQLKKAKPRTLKTSQARSQGREYLNCGGQKIRKAPYIRPRLKKQSSSANSMNQLQCTSSEAIAAEMPGMGYIGRDRFPFPFGWDPNAKGKRRSGHARLGVGHTMKYLYLYSKLMIILIIINNVYTIYLAMQMLMYAFN